MITVKRFLPNDDLTREYIDSLARALKELQVLAITLVNFPLMKRGGTLMAVNVGLPPGVVKGQMLLLDANLKWSLSCDSVEPEDGDTFGWDEDEDNAVWGPARGQT